VQPSQPREGTDLPAKIGSYRIERKLGSGGMGVVYRAFDEVLLRPLAIKQLLANRADPAAVRRFRREAQAAARLSHPAIVHIYEIVETAEGDWLVMELVEGETLARKMSDASLSLAELVRLGREIAEGLAEAHRHRVIHRDLKASNVMVTASGHAKILDFGLAKIVGESAAESPLSGAGLLLGTYHAMSPEQIQGLAVDHRSDIFSFGSLLYEMTARVHPFRGATASETLARICNLKHLPADQIQEGVPPELSKLIDRALHKDPRRRPQDASEIAESLARIEELLAAASGRERAAASPPPVWEPEPGGESTLVEGKARRPSGPAPAANADSPSPDSPRRRSERRQMTVVCCELVEAGAAATAARKPDPEILYEWMLLTRAAAQSVADRHGGSLGNVLGYRILLYFGYPLAHEDDARRAVLAALDLVSEAARIPAGGAAGRPALRVGIHTGPAIVAVSAPGSQVTLGDTLDLAIAVQELAAPGGIVVSPATCPLIQKGFSLEALPPVRLPGLAEPFLPCRLLGLLERSEESAERTLPLVGRRRDMDLLLNRWHLAREGTGQVVLLCGEAGIGKSRLLYELRRSLESEGAEWLSCYGSAYAQDSPLYPVVGLLRRAAALPDTDANPDRLAAFLQALSLAESLPVLASLLGLPMGEGPVVPELPPDRQRERTLESLVSLVLQLAERRPLVLAIEDLHWLDPTTLAWLDRLVSQAMTVPLFLVLTLRPHTTEVLWAPSDSLTQISLEPLTGTEAETLIDRVAGERSLSPAIRHQIVARTDGVPLFVEELTRSVLESGESGEGRELPATLRESLAARLDRLGTAKEVAQIAAVIGRAFSLEWLAAVSPHDEATLQRELRRLVQAGLVHRRGLGTKTSYLFKHALVQDAAYDSLLKRERQQLHLRIAEVVAAGFPEVAENQPEILAHHYAQGNEIAKAIEHLHRAGLRSLQRSANVEAIHHLERGFELLAGEEPGPQRTEKEFQLQATLGAALLVTKGFAAPEVKQVYTRADELRKELREAPALPVLWGLYTYEAVQGNLLRAREIGEELLAQAQVQNDLPFTEAGHCAVGVAHFFMGRLSEAREYLDREPFLPTLDTTAYVQVGHVPRLTMVAVSALLLWITGFPSRALARCREALQRAHESGHLYTEAAVLLIVSDAHLACRDADGSSRLAKELIALCQEHGLYMTREGLFILGCAEALQGQESGIALASANLAEQLASGFRVWNTFYSSQLIELQLRHRLWNEAEAWLDQVSASMTETQERFFEAELLRLRGELLLGREEEKGAETLFQNAIQTARSSLSRSLELRAAMSLARLWGRRKRRAEARRILADVYGGFTEGFETGDLREARALLEELSTPAST
jgi:TOMM system kinase/cyclase fusion protein